MIKLFSDYIGYKVVSENDPAYLNLHAEKNTNWFDLYENEYILVVNQDGVVVDKYKWQDGKYKDVYRKPVESLMLGKVKPKNPEQQFAIDLLMDDTVTVKMITGGFGSGKTFLACCTAFQMMQENRYEKIVWVRNNIEVKDSNPIGALPGDYAAKMNIWAMPLADHLGGRDALDMQIQRGKIEVEHLGFIRGRDIKNSIIFVTEAEHLTRDHVKLLLGRVAEGSIIIFEGDCQQIDKKAFENDNGVTAAINHLKGNRLFSYVHLRESVRSETAKLADLLDQED
ncbi:MAG: PhoH family protein [Clostridia bacterium]|nr:PhoH family protein [Clostridia bacterium]